MKIENQESVIKAKQLPLLGELHSYPATGMNYIEAQSSSDTVGVKRGVPSYGSELRMVSYAGTLILSHGVLVWMIGIWDSSIHF